MKFMITVSVTGDTDSDKLRDALIGAQILPAGFYGIGAAVAVIMDAVEISDSDSAGLQSPS